MVVEKERILFVYDVCEFSANAAHAAHSQYLQIYVSAIVYLLFVPMHHSRQFTNLPNEEGTGGNSRGTSSHTVNRQPTYICAHCRQGILTVVGMRPLLSGCAHCCRDALTMHGRQCFRFCWVGYRGLFMDVWERVRGKEKYVRGGVEGHICHWRFETQGKGDGRCMSDV